MIENFRKRFNFLKNNGINLEIVLDIGAYQGSFTNTVKSIWENVKVIQIEADDRHKNYLNSGAIFAVLGNEEKEVDFYTLDEGKINTGSSIFIELSPHYTESTTLTLKKSMTTLDSLDNIHNFSGNWKNSGLVKIDTQGSELIILEGASNFLKEKSPRFILLECSIVQYNLGSPLISDIFLKMKELNYKPIDIFDLSYYKETLLQVDVLFERL